MCQGFESNVILCLFWWQRIETTPYHLLRQISELLYIKFPNLPDSFTSLNLGIKDESWERMERGLFSFFPLFRIKVTKYERMYVTVVGGSIRWGGSGKRSRSGKGELRLEWSIEYSFFHCFRLPFFFDPASSPVCEGWYSVFFLPCHAINFPALMLRPLYSVSISPYITFFSTNSFF
jgi:hypothetical protein